MGLIKGKSTSMAIRNWLLLASIGVGISPSFECAAEASESPSGASPAPLVFVHGIKGSELVESLPGDQRETVKWLTLSGALGLSTPDLSLEPRFVDGTQPFGGLHPGRILSSIRVVPYLFEVDVYGSWLKEAKRMGRPFYPFSYDWRRDLLETTATLAKFLESVKARHGVAPQVVAHSMGGLITLAALNRRPDLFSHVVFAGVPFAGGVGFLEDLHAGVANGLNRTILRPSVLWTFPSVYTLQPLTAADELEDGEGRRVDVDFYATESWCRVRLGPCASGALDPKWQLFLDEALARAKRFRQLLAEVPVAGLPPILVVASKSQPTLVKALKGGSNSVEGWDFASASRAPGDGRVAFDRAMPPSSLPYQLLESEREHTEMLADPIVVDAIKKGAGIAADPSR